MKSSALEITLKEFMAIAEIPRPSHHEEKIGAYLVEWAQKRGLTVEQDAIGDVIIDKPAAPGHERAPLVIIQAHMDMVCVAAEGVPFDPLKDPIKVINDGKTLRAKGTSLGADDGIGVALALYLLQDESLVHGPLRVILTVNEEDGMSSIAMPDKYLDGAYLINLDWEWLGSLCNSAAGGDFLSFTRKAEWTAPSADDHAVKITLKGLLGGHSGVGINLGRANALVCLATALSRIAEAGIPIKIADFHGGQAKNAIPAQAEAVITIPAGSKGQAKELLSAYKKDFAAAFGDIEHSYALTINDEKAPSQVLHPEIGRALISLLNTLPNNINTMSPFVTTLTESSQNLGFLKIDDQTITLEAMERSCVAYRAEEMLRASRLIAEAFGFTYTQGDHVPAWAVNPHSELVPLACEVYSELTGRNMVVEPVHGGLECGAFFEKNPDLDMIAIGPSLTDVHSPDESCDIESIRVTAELVIRILEKLAYRKGGTSRGRASGGMRSAVPRRRRLCLPASLRRKPVRRLYSLLQRCLRFTKRHHRPGRQGRRGDAVCGAGRGGMQRRYRPCGQLYPRGGSQGGYAGIFPAECRKRFLQQYVRKPECPQRSGGTGGARAVLRQGKGAPCSKRGVSERDHRGAGHEEDPALFRYSGYPRYRCKEKPCGDLRGGFKV